MLRITFACLPRREASNIYIQTQKRISLTQPLPPPTAHDLERGGPWIFGFPVRNAESSRQDAKHDFGGLGGGERGEGGGGRGGEGGRGGGEGRPRRDSKSG